MACVTMNKKNKFKLIRAVFFFQALFALILIGSSPSSSELLMDDCKSAQSTEKIRHNMIEVSKLSQRCAFSKAHALLKSNETAVEVAEASVTMCDKFFILLEQAMCKDSYRTIVEEGSSQLVIQSLASREFDQLVPYKKSLIDDLRAYIIEERVKGN
jgi:hypothetical protein